MRKATPPQKTQKAQHAAHVILGSAALQMLRIHLFKILTSRSQLVLLRNELPYFCKHIICPWCAVLVGLDVCVLVADVDLVVDALAVIVVDVMGVVVFELVAVDMAVVVGVVISQVRNEPLWYASVMVLKAAAVAGQSELSNKNWLNAHVTVSFCEPPGPLYSFVRLLMAAAVSLHDTGSTSTPLNAADLAEPHLMTPGT